MGKPPLEGRSRHLRQSLWPKLSKQGSRFKQAEARVNLSLIEELLHAGPTDLRQTVERAERAREMRPTGRTCSTQHFADNRQALGLALSERKPSPASGPQV